MSTKNKLESTIKELMAVSNEIKEAGGIPSGKMILVIEEWWNKVVDDPTEKSFGTRVLPEFELKSRMSYPRCGGWKSKAEWKKSIKGRTNFVCFTDDGKAKVGLSNYFGIAMYMLVYLEVGR